MKKWNRIFLAGLLAIVASGIAWLTLRTREPVYQGKSLTAWLEQDLANPMLFYLVSGSIESWHPPPGYEENEAKKARARDEAEAAIRHIGTNALPYLMKMTAVRDAVLKDELADLLNKQSIIRVRFRWAQDCHIEAIEGLSLIIPALTNRLSVDENETNRWRIVGELEDTGIHVTEMPAAGRKHHLPHVRPKSTDDDVGDITELCRNALTNALSDKSFKVRSAATNALKRIGAAEARTAMMK